MRKPKRAPGSRCGRLAHRLHAAGDADVEVAGADRLVGEPDRAHARGADLVHGLRGHLLGDAGLDLGLARGDLSLAGLQHLAVDDALDLVGRDLGPIQGLGDRGAAQLGRVEGSEAAAHLPERGPGRGEDHRLRHLRLSSRCASARVGIGCLKLGPEKIAGCESPARVCSDARAGRGIRQAAGRGRRRADRGAAVQGRGAARGAARGPGRRGRSRRLPQVGPDPSREPEAGARGRARSARGTRPGARAGGGGDRGQAGVCAAGGLARDRAARWRRRRARRRAGRGRGAGQLPLRPLQVRRRLRGGGRPGLATRDRGADAAGRPEAGRARRGRPRHRRGGQPRPGAAGPALQRRHPHLPRRAGAGDRRHPRCGQRRGDGSRRDGGARHGRPARRSRPGPTSPRS